MFCPDCGAENSRGQKYCTRCGTNLAVIDRAREIVSEMTAGTPVPQFESSSIIKSVALISIFGIVFVTLGTVIISAIDSRPPMPFFFAICGFGALVLICRRLLGLVKSAGSVEKSSRHADYIPPATPKATNRALNEPSPSYNSVIEETTQQFDAERQKR
jgi:F0F1-type ATP synthase assembly protein I